MTLDMIIFQFSSVAQLCPTLCNPIEPLHARPPCPSPIRRVHPNPCPLSWGDAIQPPYLVLFPSLPAPNLSQHQGLFK